MVYHVSMNEDAKHFSMLMRTLPTKITKMTKTTILRKTKRLDLNLWLKASKLSMYSSAAPVGRHIHYNIASVAGPNAAETSKCGDLISSPEVKNGRVKDPHLGRLSELDLEKGTPCFIKVEEEGA